MFEQIGLLFEFVEFVHVEFQVDYKNIFQKMSVEDFFNEFGIVLGNYDDKLFIYNFTVGCF